MNTISIVLIRNASRGQPQTPKTIRRKDPRLRTARGLSQEQLAELTGFHRTYIGMVERGERNLSLSNAGVFADVFEITISELLTI